MLRLGSHSMISWHLECSCKTHACVRGGNRATGQLKRNDDKEMAEDNYLKINALKYKQVGFIV